MARIDLCAARYSSANGLPLRSAPAQNALPVPVMTPTLSVGSASSHFQIMSSSAWPSWLIQFRSLGLFSRTSKTPGAGYESTTYFPDGSSSSKFGLDILLKIEVAKLGQRLFFLKV